jgi:hypothetical protein
VAYIRGSQITFIVLPEMLSKAPFFNRIKMWRKFKGHAVYGANTYAVNAPRGNVPRPFGGSKKPNESFNPSANRGYSSQASSTSLRAMR